MLYIICYILYINKICGSLNLFMLCFYCAEIYIYLLTYLSASLINRYFSKWQTEASYQNRLFQVFQSFQSYRVSKKMHPKLFN